MNRGYTTAGVGLTETRRRLVEEDNGRLLHRVHADRNATLLAWWITIKYQVPQDCSNRQTKKMEAEIHI